ncbi:MAG TPA: type III pantothenate kinase [Pyrinomonadaceae bacterium]|nr:type III pantothenate kinase [Pyrinomonadaceae bacterium]
MLLAVDIGNSAIKFGLFEGDTLTSKFSIPTKRDATSDEIRLAVGDHLSGKLERAIVCSVVPEIESAIRSFLSDSVESEPVFVDNSFDFGLKINYEPLSSLGTDRLVVAYAAVERHGVPCIVCSLGTATTIDVVSDSREFLGGVIAPGVDAMSEALHLKAAKLPHVEPTRSNTVLGNSTVDAIRSGVYYGYVALVEGLVTRIRTESGVSRIVATGGNASRLASELSGMVTVDEDLVLHGLKILSTDTISTEPVATPAA